MNSVSIYLTSMKLVPASALVICALAYASSAFAFAASARAVDPAAESGASAFPQDSTPDVSVFSGDPVCIPGHSVTIHTVMEFQDGLWAWRPVGRWDICVNDGGTSQITVNFKDERYQAIIAINGHHVDMAPPADRGWAFVFTRQDLLSGEPSAPACQASFVLDPGYRHRFELDGHYYDQSRNLRFAVTY